MKKNLGILGDLSVKNGVKNEKSEDQNDKISEIGPPGLGIRHLQTLLCFLCLTCAYSLRVNLSVAIVAMVDRNSANPDFEEFDWNESTQSLILSSFFWGYVFTQIPAGQLAERYGAKLMLLMAIGICSLLNLITPLVASVGGWEGLCAIRVICGFCQGCIFPSTHALLSKWSPVSERGKLSTFCYAGSQFGTVLMLSSSGVLAASAGGWPSIFYISGGVGCCWTVLWYFYGCSTPAEYKSISPEEKSFIETSIGTDPDQKEKPMTPWKEILTSFAFYSLMIVHCAHNWGFWTLLTEMPTYMKNVLGLDIKKNALLSALPYFVMWALSLILGVVAEQLVKRKLIGLAASRRLFNTIGHWGPACALIGLAYVEKGNTELAVTLLTIAVGINSATYLGFQVNHIDLAPNFAGTLMGITNCAANIMSIIAPLLVGFIVYDNKNPDQWRIVFFISSGFYFVGNLMFILFGKFTVQPWNEPKMRSQLIANQQQQHQQQQNNQSLENGIN